MPDLVTAKVFKQKDMSLGIVFKEDKNGNTVIKEIDYSGLLGSSGLEPGMKLVSINGINCETLSKKFILDIIRQAEGTLTLVAGKITTKVETFTIRVTKKSKNEKIGISLAENESEPGAVFIKTVKEDGKLAGTGIRPGMKVISINGVPIEGYKSHEVIQLLSEAVGEVTVEVKDGPPPSTKKAVQSREIVNSQAGAVVAAQPMPVAVASPYMCSPMVAIPPPPGVKVGGVWGTSKYIGEKTFAFCCVAVLIGGLCGAFVLCCPMDKRDTYSVDGKVYDASGKFLGFLKNGYPFKARMPGFR